MPTSNGTTEYLKPNETSPPSMMKKSPLAMLVETCSSIGQELSRTTRPMENAVISMERRKLSNSSTSPHHNSKSTTPVSSASSPKAHLHQRTQKSVNNPSNISSSSTTPLLLNGGLYPNNNGNNLTAAASLATAAQYQQLMYQQLMYQAELEFIKAQELLAAHKSLSSGKAQLCSICCLTPGYTGGRCIHTELAAVTGAPVNPLLAMLTQHPPLANNKASNGSKTNSKLSVEQDSQGANLKQPQISPASKCPSLSNSTQSPSNKVAPLLFTRPAQSKECHWTDGARGYCGKKFSSQEELMEHLKLHVTSMAAAAELHTPSKHLPIRSRFQPYSFMERGVVPAPAQLQH